MLTAIAIDDEPIALDVVRSHASKVPFVELKAEFTDAFKAMDFLQKNNVELIFLDIKMPDISGLDFYKSLSKKPMVIFTTAYSEHAVSSFELDAVDYLLKPFSLSRFIKGCNKAYELFNLRNVVKEKDHLFVKTGYDQVRILFDDLYYLEATGNYVTFVLKNEKVLSRMTISECDAILPEKKFIRVHRSFIAAINKIEKIERHVIHIDGNILPVGISYLQNLQEITG